MSEKTTIELKEGAIILFDKPLTWTSFDVVNYVRKVIGPSFKERIKVGHAGTLDPLASGLLVLCTGAFTKKIDQLQILEKEYTATIVIGATTPSFDLEKAIDKTFPVSHITEELIRQRILEFIGTTQQTPPVFSAKKIDGERAYEKARRGEQTEMKPVEITITDFEVLSIEFVGETIELQVRIVCTKGTYIRSIAQDLGVKLNSGAYLSALRRTRIGEFSVNNSLTLEEFRGRYSKPRVLSE